MKKTKMRKKQTMGFIAAFILAFSLWLYWGNTSIQTSRRNISSEKIPAEFDGFTIVHVSDLHNAAFGRNQDRLLHAIKDGSPDVIAVTGDLIDSNRTDVPTAMEFIHGAAAIAPVYYVTGNHEARSPMYPELEQQMIEAGDTYGDAAVIDMKSKDMGRKNGEYTILLSHRPELFDVYAANNMDLILSGHAHGGQVRLPFAGGLLAPNQGFFPEYSEGVHEKAQSSMVVNRGLGNSVIPLRVNNRPELVIVTLKASNPPSRPDSPDSFSR
ncbi:metallophosphoesterase [Lachnospiraceae bacterium 54-53]